MGERSFVQEYETRFFSKVNIKGEDDCWEWEAGCFTNGYGEFTCCGKKYKAHRFSYEFFYGKIQEDLDVLHICDNPKCVNPRHLILGTNQDNIDDRNNKGRQAKGETDGNGCVWFISKRDCKNI